MFYNKLMNRHKQGKLPRANKTRFKWSAKFQHWYFISSWVVSSHDMRMLMFNIELNHLNGCRN